MRAFLVVFGMMETNDYAYTVYYDSIIPVDTIYILYTVYV